MPKRLPSEEHAADPVRSRLESSMGRIGELASRAAAPQSQPKTVRPQPQPLEGPRVVEEAVNPGPPPTTEAPPAHPEHQQQYTLSRDRRRRRNLGAAVNGETETLTVTKKVRFTPSEARANTETLQLITDLTESKPGDSGLTRVMWALLREAEMELKRQGRNLAPLRRPPNGPSIEMTEYEHQLGRFILSALKGLE